MDFELPDSDVFGFCIRCCSDFDSLDESEAELNNQLALDVAERELGISPIMTGQEMSELDESDSLCMVMYLSQLHDLLKDTAPPSGEENQHDITSQKDKTCCLLWLYVFLSLSRHSKLKGTVIL